VMGWSARLQAFAVAGMCALSIPSGGGLGLRRRRPTLVDRCYSAVQPPSMERIAPVIDRAASEVRKTA